MRGGHNQKPDSLKALQGTFRSDRAKPALTLPALQKWPRCPAHFSDAEKAAWKELGAALLPLGVVSAADLPLAARTAQIMAKVNEALADPKLKPTTVASLTRLQVELFKAFGLSPASRRGIQALPQDDGEEADEDPLAVFE